MQKVSFLKLDIEGAEYEVLHECRELLGNVQNIFVEYHSFADKKQELSGILKILENAGFRYYIEHIGVKSHHPFIGISNYVDFDDQTKYFWLQGMKLLNLGCSGRLARGTGQILTLTLVASCTEHNLYEPLAF